MPVTLPHVPPTLLPLPRCPHAQHPPTSRVVAVIQCQGPPYNTVCVGRRGNEVIKGKWGRQSWGQGRSGEAPTKESQPSGLRDCEVPAVILNRKKNTNQCMSFCSNCWQPSPRFSYSLMGVQIYGLSILNKNTVPWDHAVCLFPCHGEPACTQSCLPRVQEAGQEGHICCNSISTKCLKWAHPQRQKKAEEQLPGLGEGRMRSDC